MSVKVSVGGNLLPVINFSMQQNYVPVIRNLIFTNITSENIQNVKLKISFEPHFAHDFESDIAILAPGEPIELSPVRINLIPDYLLSLTEKLIGNIHIDVYASDEKIYSHVDTIELLAYDQWPGALVMPEMICAFITPNHPKVTEIIGKAGLRLQKWMGNPAFTGYQTGNPNTVRYQMAAIYAALQAENIAYTMPPASYEVIGQRVRFPNVVLEQKMGICIDLAVLYASCLEAVGLNPIIIIIQGHAFCGCWLEKECFSECIQDDVSVIGKRIAEGIDEICLVECTDYVAGELIGFERSVRNANSHLQSIDKFLLAVDVQRSRASGIRPAPMRVSEDGLYKAIGYGERNSTEITSAPDEINLVNRVKLIDGKVEYTKQKLWERKLLDLSMRNVLVSFRVTQNTIQLMTGNLSTLEDTLAGGETFRILAKPTDWENTLRDSKIFEIENQKDAMEQLVQSEFQNKRLRTFLEAAELDERMKYLHRNAKLSMEENGSNTLYLALGFLRWFESDISEKIRYAPLVLIPVEISRKVQAKEYVIRVRDEEPQMNITLLEMLKQDFGIDIGGLDPLPSDESGVDLKIVFSVIRQAVMSRNRWDVEEMAFLGLFSFSQFIMWNDIRSRTEDLEKNKIVRSLISGRMEWTPEDDAAFIENLDDRMPSDTAIPASVDASQLAAIYSASGGQSFVLHGPPGTGKSQTITNLIANSLYQGKSVLFVAEKIAALTVVQRRLEAIGLAPFSLELHSNKAQKKTVLDQLERTLSLGKVKPPEGYLVKSERLYEFRTELNRVVDELHKQRDYGATLYEAIVRFEENISYKGNLRFTTEQVESMDNQSYEKWKDIIHKLSAACTELSISVSEHPLRLFQTRNYTFIQKDGFAKALRNFKLVLEEIHKEYDGICNLLGISIEASYDNIGTLGELCFAVSNSDYVPEAMLNSPDLKILHTEADRIIKCVERIQSLETKLFLDFDKSILNYDVQASIRLWKIAEQKWFIPKLLSQNKLMKELRSYSSRPTTVNKENIVDTYESLVEYHEQLAEVEKKHAEFSQLFGSLWRGADSDCVKLKDAFETALSIQELTAKISVPMDSRKILLQKLSDLLSTPYDAVKDKRLERFFEIIKGFLAITHSLRSEYGMETDRVKEDSAWLDSITDQVEACIKYIYEMRAWSVFLTICDEAEHMGLENVTNRLKSGQVSYTVLFPAFECALFLECASYTLQNSQALKGFQGVQFEETIKRFKEVNADFQTLTMQELAARLSAKIPTAAASVANSSEIGILQRAIKSKGRMMSIRSLFDRIPNLLRRLCPCMLMSPISVAQYIDPSFPKFDLVVFDEASQIPTCEAVGAIARGENVLVVGDPKQLPPTSFFNSNWIDENNFEKEDMESLLDDCLALSMPQQHLLWHYRSRHESLIAYSNQKYYDNNLRTFPSPKDLTSEVRLIPVDGFYDRGNTKQNMAEAKAVVAEIVRRLRDENLKYDSIGVVTFSAVQQNLIDDLLMEEFRKHPELEETNNNNKEQIFIKNLENVQGDERDVILFSIGYGPDKEGKVTLNFGPLNREGGWRRLNVAISRARKSMLVFSVLKPEQIDLSRTRATGLEGLKGFLEYAAKGTTILASNNERLHKRTNGFENLLAKQIKELGYDVKCNVGCSEYKIDLAVVDPMNSGEYILGIICDGENSCSAKTAADRNVLQPNMLSSLGWNIHNVWILDWLENPSRELEKIKEAINDSIENRKTDSLAIKGLNLSSAYEEGGELNFNSDFLQSKDSRSNEQESLKNLAYSLQFELQQETPKPNPNQKLYEDAEINNTDNPEKFYLSKTAPSIMRMIETVIEKEAPISRKLLGRKILSAWGIARAGSNVDRIIDDSLNRIGVMQTAANGTYFLWKKEQNPETYSEYRIPAKDSKRNMDEICPEEIANAINEIMHTQISLSKIDLIRETAKVFGYTRLGNVIEVAVEGGIRLALNRGYISASENGDRLYIVDKRALT